MFLILSLKLLNRSCSNSQPKFERRSSSYKRETEHLDYCYVNNWKAQAVFLFTYWMLIRKYKFSNKEIWKSKTKIVTIGVQRSVIFIEGWIDYDIWHLFNIIQEI